MGLEEIYQQILMKQLGDQQAQEQQNRAAMQRLSPQDFQGLAGLGAQGDQGKIYDEQIAQADALRDKQPAAIGWGSGLASGLSNMIGGIQSGKAMADKQKLVDQLKQSSIAAANAKFGMGQPQGQPPGQPGQPGPLDLQSMMAQMLRAPNSGGGTPLNAARSMMPEP